MKILVPTDFSPLARVALNFAVAMGKKLNAEIYLLHTVYLDAHAHTMAAFKSERIIEAMIENARVDFIRLLEDIDATHSGVPSITTHVIRNDYVEDSVEDFSQQHNIDYIILGTKGATGMKKVLMGSNAVSIIKRCRKPVITVPENATFNEIKTLVYASDLEDVNRELRILISFAEVFNSHIHLVHVDQKGILNEALISEMEQKLRGLCLYPQFTIKTFQNISVQHALEKYIASIDADMLAMFTHKTGFFESLFGKSVTNEMAFHSTVPLLSVKK